eukprot:scaffold54317_cov59-Phaeocystis_antarctica.AAC.1
MEAEVEPASSRVDTGAGLQGASSRAHLECGLAARAPDRPVLDIFVLDPDRTPLPRHAWLVVALLLAPHAPRAVQIDEGERLTLRRLFRLLLHLLCCCCHSSNVCHLSLPAEVRSVQKLPLKLAVVVLDKMHASAVLLEAVPFNHPAMEPLLVAIPPHTDALVDERLALVARLPGALLALRSTSRSHGGDSGRAGRGGGGRTFRPSGVFAHRQQWARLGRSRGECRWPALAAPSCGLTASATAQLRLRGFARV